MDSTQMICDSILESDEENEEGNKHDDRGDPLAKLCILKNEHIPEKELPLFLGDNMLGRDPNTCTLSLLAPSVSKQHAMVSLSMYRRKGCESVEVEALLWDLGSLNGTRKGHFKLTPNVRYALSEGDSLVVADIPCKYIRCTADTPYTPKDATTSMNQNLNSKARLRDASRENGGNSSVENTKNIAGCTKTMDPLPDSKVTGWTPARTTCLSFEQTPTQSQGTLVRDSESDSDEERSSVGDRRRRNIVTDSDSYKSSPTCSTFLSPTNKVVPESEDESPITPSSSNKIRPNRLVSFNNEQSGVKEEEMALEIVGDSEEEAETDEARATLVNVHNKNGQPELANRECNTSLEGGIQLPLTTPVVSTDVPQFNMDSDTDLEEDERLVSAIPVSLSNAQASNPAQFHMDNDTNVDDNDTHRGPVPALLSDDATKHFHSIPVIQPKGISMDSDTDVDDEDLVSATTAKPTVSQTAITVEVGATTSPQEFHLDSDTDVDEEEINTTGTKLQDTPSQTVVKTALAESTSAAPQSLNLDSDTDDEGILSAAVTEQPVESARADLEIVVNSDTDVEDDSPPVKLVTSGPSAAVAQSDTDADPDINENIVTPAVGQDNPAEVTLDSDTDVEDKDADIQEAGNNQIPILHREVASGHQGSLQPNCSTPVQLSEGNIEELETQAFLSPSSLGYAVAPAGRPGTFSYPLDSQEDDDFVGAETQSFILQHEDPNQSSGVASIGNEKDVGCATGGTFQLELSDSSHLQNQAHVLAMESTQAFDNVGVNLQETQLYADAITTDGKESPVDIALQATQAYISEPYSDTEDETPEDKPTEIVLTTSVPEVEHLMRKDNTSVPESNHNTLFKTKEEAGQATPYKQTKVLSIAETQPLSIDEESDSEESPPGFRKRKAKQIQEEETQPLQNTKFTMAETQPMNWDEDKESDEDSPPVFRKRKAKQLPSEEEQTQPIDIPKDEQSEEDPIQIVRRRKEKHLDPEEETQDVDSELTVAETQPISLTKNGESDGEDSVPIAINQKAKQLQPEDQETQPIVNSELSVAPTQSVVLSEDMRSDAKDSFPGPRKRKAKPLEDTESLTISEADTHDSETIISKEEEGASAAVTRRVSVRNKVGAKARLRKKEPAVAEQVRADPLTRQTKGKSKAVPASRRVKPRVDPEDESKKETQRTKEDLENTEGKTGGTEQEEKERLEKERKEQEGKEIAALVQKEKEEKQKEILEKEKRVQEENERMDRKQKEREDKERLETAKRFDKEVKRLEVERKDQEHKAQLEMEEKERLKKDQTPRRGRRTIAAPESSTTPNEDFPARRTRSRSNSSNSVSSERSVPGISSQNTRGRGRGARRTDVPVQNTVSRASNRRRTVAAETSVQTDPSSPSPRVLSRSNSSNSLNSEISSCSVSSQSRRRGGRQRGRGRRTEAKLESVCSVSAQSDQTSIQKAPQRGRRSQKNSSDDKTDSQQSGTTRGQGGAMKKQSECTPEYEEDQSNQEEACTSNNSFQKSEIRSLESPDTSLGTVDNVRRGGRKREIETNAKKDSKTKFQKTEEADDARATSTRARSSVKKDVKEESSKTEEPRVKNQPLVLQKKKRGDRGDSSPSGNNSMEQEANSEEQEPQTPTSSASRRRHSANSDFSPVAKIPRSSTASPSTFGRLRATSQAYKVLFTGVVDEAGENVLSLLGGSIAKDVANMTCLVTDKVRRTVKFLCAVAKGVPIVTTQWLEKSGKAGTFLSPRAYIVKDSEQEHNFNFILQDSLRIASSQPLLQGYEIHVTKSVKPEPLHMKDIISCSGATFLPRMPSSKEPQTLVISCEEDWSLCGPAVSSGIPVVTAEFILTGILQQKLDFETHKLSGPIASVQPTRGRSRKKT